MYCSGADTSSAGISNDNYAVSCHRLEFLDHGIGDRGDCGTDRACHEWRFYVVVQYREPRVREQLKFFRPVRIPRSVGLDRKRRLQSLLFCWYADDPKRGEPVRRNILVTV